MKPLRSSSLVHLLTGLALVLNAVCAAPHDNARLPYSQLRAYGSSPCKNTRPWARLRDWVIGSIWPAAVNHDSVSSFNKTPAQLRTHYDDLVLRFNASTAAEVASLTEASETLFLDVWGYHGGKFDLRLSKDVVPSLLQLLPASLQSAHTLLLSSAELAKAAQNTYPGSFNPLNTPVSSSGTASFSLDLSHPHDNGPNIFFREYRPLSIIYPWMLLLGSLFPSHVEVISIGKSYEGRDISALKVGVHPTNNEQPSKPRKTVIISGGTHAREWISITTVNYIAYSFITSYGKAGEVTKLLEDFDWIFLPTLNPDGYVYSWEMDRLWRKNRQPNTLRFCPGIDLDRSFGFMWDRKSTEDNPCSESYAGEAPFEGYEALQLAQWAKDQTESGNAEFVGLIDLHSYSQQILYPYSYSCSEQPPTLEDLEELGEGLAKAIRLNHHHIYQVVPACEGNVFTKGNITHTTLDNGGGSLLDWFYHDMGVRNAFQIKLPDTGSYGFLLPNTYIAPTGEEIFQAVKYFGVSLASDTSSRKFEESSTSDGQSQQPLT